MKWLAIILLGALYLLPVHVEPENFIHDDAYFYVQIAANIADGRGSTFHDITPTNGYHPLWMLPCVFAVLVARGDLSIALHVITLLQGLLAVASLLLLHRFLKRCGLSEGEAGLGMAVLAAFLFGTALFASEAHINAAMLMLSLLLLASALDPRGGAHPIVAGTALALAVLARLDNVFVASTLAGAFAFAEVPRGQARALRRLSLLLFPSLLLVGGYMLWNQASYGHPTPISGVIKSTFPHMGGTLSNLSELGKGLGMFAIVGCAVTPLLALERSHRLLFWGLGLGVLARACYVVLFTDHYTFWTWYHVPGATYAALLSAAAIRSVRGHFRGRWQTPVGTTLLRAGIVFAVAAGAGYAWGKALNPTRIGPFASPFRFAACRWPEQVGDWMRENLPENAGVLAYDWPGALAIRSHLRVLSADGLVNDFAYNRELVELGATDYLCRADVGYYFGRLVEQPGAVGPQRELVVTRVADGLQELEIRAPLTQQPAGRIIVRDADLLIRVRDIVDCPEDAADAGLWKLDLGCEHRGSSSGASAQRSPSP